MRTTKTPSPVVSTVTRARVDEAAAPKATAAVDTVAPTGDRFEVAAASTGAHATAPANEGTLRELLRDLDEGMRLLKQMPAAVSVLGSARVREGDRAYDSARVLGEKLALAGVPVRTGAGPGVMGAVPRGYIEGRESAVDDDKKPQRLTPGSEAPNADEGDLRTQGFNIVLPHEQGVDPSIEHHMALKHFPFRKLMLFENTRALVTMPGGFGTLDEMFELWVMPHRDPMLTLDTAFYGPLFDAVNAGAREKRALISDEDWRRMTLTDDLDEVVRASTSEHVSGFEEHPDVLARRLASELEAVYDALGKTPPSVSFLGAAALSSDDPALRVLEEAAARLSAQGHGARVAGDRSVARAVATGAEQAGKRAHAFPRHDDPPVGDLVDVKVAVTDVVTQKQALTRGIEGIIAAPGDLHTLSVVFTFLCEVQCGKVPRVPIVLVGSDYWQPIFDAVQRSMLEGERQTISPKDLELVTITDDPDVVVAAFQGARSTPVPGHAAPGKAVTKPLSARLENAR